jgi:predicted PurR-regulated permease PerM
MLGKTGSRVLVLAAAVIVVAAMQLGQSVLISFAYSGLLAALLAPAVRWLRNRRVPNGVAVVGVIFGVFAAGVVGLSMLAGAMESFLNELPAYSELLDARWSEAVAWFDTQGVDVQSVLDEGVIDPGAILSNVGTLLSSVAGVASDLLMVSLLSMFLMLEIDEMVAKIRIAFDDQELTDAFLNSGESLQAYLGIKTMTSALTGVLAGVGLWLYGIDHAALWGFIAFLLNYIPTIGSIVAAVPPVLLAIVLGGVVDAAVVGALYLTINTVVGSVIEPRVMGDQLGLSSFVVLLALLAWGFVWGIHGMLLSVPLTVLLQQLCMTQDDTRWIGILMGPAPDESAT